MEYLQSNRTEEHYNNYELLKDVLHRQRSLGELRKLTYQESLEEPLTHVINLQIKQCKCACNIFELMELQDLIPEDQLLIVEMKPADRSCHFLFVGPPVPNSLYILKDGPLFHGRKDIITFFKKYCLFHCCC